MLAQSAPATARRLKALIDPIHVVAYFADEPDRELRALGLRNSWDAYFAGRAAPLGRTPAEVVHAAFYNFADGEVARHVPRVWDLTTPAAALAARQRGCVAALRRILGRLADSPAVARAADLAVRAGLSGPPEGRILYAALRALPVPDEPVARLWHGATLLREFRGDGHITALVAAGISGTESHVLQALWEGTPAERFGRVQHLPADRLAAVIAGLRDRGLIGADGWLTAAGRETRERIEAMTDRLDAPAYRCLTPAELHRLIIDLDPIAGRLEAAGSR